MNWLLKESAGLRRGVPCLTLMQVKGRHLACQEPVIHTSNHKEK